MGVAERSPTMSVPVLAEPAGFAAGERVMPPLFDSHLVVELVEAGKAGGIEQSGSYGVGHGATRLSQVTAVTKTAACCQSLYLGEDLVKIALPCEAKAPDTGRIDQHTAARYDDELARARRVPSALVPGADSPGRLQILADKGVDKSRLACSGSAQQHRCVSWSQQAPDSVESIATGRADADHLDGAKTRP